MVISTERGGGQVVSADDETRFYDDVGCLAADWAHRPAGARAFVRIGDAWIDAAAAAYARPAGARTPMGSGLAAFTAAADAAAADRNGRALTFDDIVAAAGGSR